MFVEKLSCEQANQIAKKICEHLEEKKYEIIHFYLSNEYKLQIVIYSDKIYGNYSIEITDTHVHYMCKELAWKWWEQEEMSKICAKELYKIFGDEYRDFYMKQVNSIFE